MNRESALEPSDFELLFPAVRQVAGPHPRTAAQSGDQPPQPRSRKDLVTRILHSAMIEIELDDEFIIRRGPVVKSNEFAGIELLLVFAVLVVFVHGCHPRGSVTVPANRTTPVMLSTIAHAKGRSAFTTSASSCPRPDLGFIRTAVAAAASVPSSETSTKPS